jgi:hypothetical protein
MPKRSFKRRTTKTKRSFNQPAPKKYRPTRKEQGLYTVRNIGEALPQPPSLEVLALEMEAARRWAAINLLEAKGIQKRNLRGRDVGRVSVLSQ